MEGRSKQDKHLRICPRNKVERAAAIIREFAARHGWSELCPNFDKITVKIMPDQEALRCHLRTIGELKDSGPHGLVAAVLPKMILILEQEGIAKVRPEYLVFDDGWVRLLAHEFAHMLHEALVAGHEEQLGPRWFFEGFACMAAGQRLGHQFDSESPAQVLEAVRLEGRKQYAVFEAAVRYFSQSHDLAELVERAGDSSFEEWLIGHR